MPTIEELIKAQQGPQGPPFNPMAGLPPGRPINPMMGSQAPQQQQPQQQQSQATPLPPTGGGGVFASLFGGEQGQNLPTKSRRQLGRDALFNAGLSLLESSGPNAEGFTATSLQGLARSLAMGRQTFGAGVETFEEEATKDLLDATGKGPEERLEALRSVRNDFIAQGNAPMTKVIDDMIKQVDPLGDFGTISLGDGQFVTTNESTGETKIGGTSFVDGPPKNWVKFSGVNPATGKVTIGFYDKNNPFDMRFTPVEPSVDVDTELSSKARIGFNNAVSALTDLSQFYGIADIDAPLDEITLANTPGFVSQILTQFDVTRGLTDDQQQLFDTARQRGIEAIARISTGAAINAGEESRFKRMLPNVNDNKATVVNKMRFLRDLRNVLEEIKNKGIVDPQQAADAIRASGIVDRADPTADQPAGPRSAAEGNPFLR